MTLSPFSSLVSLPPAVADYLNTPEAHLNEPAIPADLLDESNFVGSDPASRKLGSGGGTVHLLHQAWLDYQKKKHLDAADRDAWLAGSSRLILHAGGQSRRLPAYSAASKALIPIPLRTDIPYAKFQQTLCDFQIPLYTRALREAGPKAKALLSSGDVWLDFNVVDIPRITSDLVGVGMRVSPQMASHFGVFFVKRGQELESGRELPIAFFLQKPSADVIEQYVGDYDFYVDTGLWFFSQAVIDMLFNVCGWQSASNTFDSEDGFPNYLDFYADLCVGLGTEAKRDAKYSDVLSKVSARVIPLEQAKFYHLGTSRQVFESLDELQEGGMRIRKSCYNSFSPQQYPFPVERNQPIWLDAVLQETLPRLAGHNIVSGLPAKATLESLAMLQCVDCAPVGEDDYALRPYHLDDSFRGSPNDGALICGQDAKQWLKKRQWPGPFDEDVFTLKLYPLLAANDIEQGWVDWFFSDAPDAGYTKRFLEASRISASETGNLIHCARYFEQKKVGTVESLRSIIERMATDFDSSLFLFDFSQFASVITKHAPDLIDDVKARKESILEQITLPEHKARFLTFLNRLGIEDSEGKSFRQAAFEVLKSAVIKAHQWKSHAPTLALKKDQIVWARSPARFDLAGGWTDTPPYCFEKGGAVLNLAVNLNGQPPIQTFVRATEKLSLKIHSIDLGISEEITTFEELASFRDPSSGFSLPKAALGLVGFLPELCEGGVKAKSLAELLQAFGSGLEISLVCAIPKGSGLGTSSILAATILGALNRACGIHWDKVQIYRKVLAVEQLLTTGGGWQDQAGAMFGGIKMIETQPGYSQLPTIRYLPEAFFNQQATNQSVLLYYTGITRLAKNILQEIVDNMFLRKAETMATIQSIRENALQLYDAIQTQDSAEIFQCVARSWELNKALDAGTTNAEIEAMLTSVDDDLEACKLLGAGGGGFLLLFAKDAVAGARIREKLEANPPNAEARFVDFDISESGLQVTVS